MSKNYYKRFYSISEFYDFLKAMMRSIKYLRKAKKNSSITDDLVNHIMLAVTEVNGCEICDYVHTADALKNGMSEDEIDLMVAGNFQAIKSSEGVALLFAQHYADKKGKPSKEAWDRVLSTYGKKDSLAILAAIQMIMVGNIYGIAAGALKHRMQLKPIPKSTLAYELGLSLSIIPFLPIAIIDGFIDNQKGQPLLNFDS